MFLNNMNNNECNETIDNKTLLSRFKMKGNLKISISEIHSHTNTHETDKRIYNTQQYFEIFYRKILSGFLKTGDACVSVPLTRTKTLYADYCKGKLNFFIEDSEKNIFTQLIDIALVDIIARKEDLLLRLIDDIKIKGRSEKQSELSDIIHEAYKKPVQNRGSPIYNNKSIDDDFDLDL